MKPAHFELIVRWSDDRYIAIEIKALYPSSPLGPQAFQRLDRKNVDPIDIPEGLSANELMSLLELYARSKGAEFQVHTLSPWTHRGIDIAIGQDLPPAIPESDEEDEAGIKDDGFLDLNRQLHGSA